MYRCQTLPSSGVLVVFETTKILPWMNWKWWKLSVSATFVPAGENEVTFTLLSMVKRIMVWKKFSAHQPKRFKIAV